MRAAQVEINTALKKGVTGVQTRRELPSFLLPHGRLCAKSADLHSRRQARNSLPEKLMQFDALNAAASGWSAVHIDLIKAAGLRRVGGVPEYLPVTSPAPL